MNIQDSSPGKLIFPVIFFCPALILHCPNKPLQPVRSCLCRIRNISVRADPQADIPDGGNRFRNRAGNGIL